MITDQERETRRELESIARADYKAVSGGVFLAHSLTGYLGDSQDTTDICPAVPAKVRIIGGPILCWHDDWLDPLWDIELAEPHPSIPEGSSMWVSGICYSTKGETECSDLVGVERPR
jgi:hypothetical protein